MQTPRARAARRGISLLEVLISMFVLLVGLAGVAAMLPAGKSEIMQGVKLDYAMMVGRNAFRDLKARGMLKPHDASGNSLWFDVTGVGIWDNTQPTRPFIANGNTPSPAIILDPLAILANNSYGNVFPTGATGTYLTRVNPLYYLPSGSNPTPTALTGNNGRYVADTIFRCTDDATIKDNTATKNAPPLRQEVPYNSTGSNIQEYNSAGNYSWVATIVTDPTSSALNSKVTVSVAVLYKRDLSASGAGERSVNVYSMPGGGAGGGEIILNDPVKPLRPGQWIMLAGQRTVSGNTLNYFKWYRIGAASERDATSSNRQSLTLAGPDWDATNMPTPTAFILDNVIAVYEKNLDLEL